MSANFTIMPDDMAGYLGEYEAPVGSDGKILFPDDWRELKSSGNRLYVMPNIDGRKSILIVPSDRYRVDKHELGPAIKDKRLVKYTRLDQNGCLRIPDALREYAGIDEWVVFQGQFRYIKLVAK